jgi:hypothetical protein
MSEQSVIGVYDRLPKAEEAVRMLDRGGFPIKQISIVGQSTEHERDVQGYVTVEDLAKKGAGTGALAGGLLGLLTVVASVWIPGFGRLVVAGLEERLKAGGYLVIAHGSAAEVDHARHLLHSTGAEDVNLHREAGV